MKATSALRKENTTAVLETIQTNRRISKNAIAGATALSQVTVHNIVNRLMTLGICVECEERVTTGGRSAALYRINGKYGAILGQTLFRTHVTTAAFDFSLKQLYIRESRWDLADMEGCVETMIAELQKAVDCLSGWRILGIGVAVPGRSSSKRTIATIPGYKSWNDLPLNAILEERFHLPVRIDNDVNALAVSAKYNHLTDGFRDYVYLNVFEGVGMGVVIDGALFRGHRGCSSEIGHTSIMMNGPLCSCGNRGCLDAYLRDSFLLESIQTQCAAHARPIPQTLGEAVRRVREEQDPIIYSAFHEAAQFIAVAIKHILLIFDTQAVILRCPWITTLPKLFQEVSDRVYSDAVWSQRNSFTILLDDNPEILDNMAACLFMDSFYHAEMIPQIMQQT